MIRIFISRGRLSNAILKAWAHQIRMAAGWLQVCGSPILLVVKESCDEIKRQASTLTWRVMKEVNR
jgi:hypothetical protein